MKFCIHCGAQCDDNAIICPACGQPLAAQAPIDPNDHTADFDSKEISDNKVVAMLPYLLGVFGLIIAILLAGTSEYVKFHVHNALKFTVVEALLGIIALLLCWTIIVPIAAAICYVILFVLRIIAFFQICNGKAKDPAIISGLGFLK